MNSFHELIQPDLHHWEQIQQLLKAEGLNPEDNFYEEIQKLILGSHYASLQLVARPELIKALFHCEQFELQPETLVSVLQDSTDIAQIKQQLRLFRHRKLIQIIYLDICRKEPVERTLLHLSLLADELIKNALHKTEQILSARHGQPLDHTGEPMQLNILGMGKLGGRELNFSSDIDLIFTYSDEGQLKGFGQLSHSQYFTQVVKLFRQLLNDTTADGFVYRVDLRLRPWGDSGPLVLTHNAFEHYYQLHGREWERYAMVKARIITGSKSDQENLRAILTPFIYRRYHDYRVFDGLAQLKLRIDEQARRNSENHNVKTGQGGIREIEFFIQAFQILKGGRNHQLQTQSIFQAFDTLSQQHITDLDSLSQMRSSYCFLRMLENRIQMLNDQQTHEIPSRQNQQQRISLLLGYPDWDSLKEDLTRHQSQVHTIFATLFTPQDDPVASGTVAASLDDMDDLHHLEHVQALGFKEPEIIHQRLQAFYHSRALLFMSDRARKRFHVFFPEMLKQVARQSRQLELLERMLALLSSIAGRSIYFELLYQNIPMLTRLVSVFDSSSWIAQEVTRHPILLESLLYPGPLSERFNRQRLAQTLCVQLQNVSGDVELELDVLRQFRRAQTLVIASAEIAQEIATAEASLYLSELAELILQSVYKLCETELEASYGKAHCIIDEKPVQPDMGIIAYGKLGSRELHYQSDLDIIFLHNSSGLSQHTDGIKSIDNSTYFSRLAQKIISKTTLLTAAGKLYQIDTRLRPDGASGMLVSSITSFNMYQHDKAWVWEHQAITRARFIAGSPDIKSEFEKTRCHIMALPRAQQDLQKEIMQMRAKIYQIKKPREGENVNIKHSTGCMVDIEFLVQYWALLHTNKFASLCETTDNTGLINELFRLGLISAEDQQLLDIYQTFHKWLHARVLQNQSAEIPSGIIRKEIDVVKTCWNKTFTD
jgi:glutamate-ammonia-ligase adenylyltransferase